MAAVSGVVCYRPPVAVGQAIGEQPARPAPVRPAAGPWPPVSKSISVWQPEYTAYFPLPDYDGAVSLAASDDGLWLATETTVSRFAGGVWDEPQSPPRVSKIFSLAPTSADVWAFGFEGGAWQLVGDEWLERATPVDADLYTAAARGPHDVWAAGFDYGDETGVLLRWNGSGFAVHTDELSEILLFSLAGSPSGELWAGGCTYTDRLVLLRDGGAGDWHPVDTPEVAGCVYHLSFASDGHGLAAAGNDILRFDGTSWALDAVSPPDGLQWVRVAAVSDEPGEAAGRTGWAIAGLPTWRGYTDGQPPWYYDGMNWGPATTDYLGLDDVFIPTEANPRPRPFMDLVATDDGVFSVSGTAAALNFDVQAAFMTLSDGAARFSHPLLASAAYVDTGGGSDVWVGGRAGAVTIQRREGDSWQPAIGNVFDENKRVAVSALDMASDEEGWAIGTVTDDPLGLQGPWSRAAWQFDGSEWRERAAPSGILTTLRLRAMPNGGAWVATPSGDLYAYFGTQWVRIPGAPSVPATRPSDLPTGVYGVPFDFASDDGDVVGCVAGRDGLYEWNGITFTRSGRVPRGDVIDLQLVSRTNGWAIATDPSGDRGPYRPSGVLLQIRDCNATEIPIRLQGQNTGIETEIEDAEWRQMSAAREGEVWLWGTISGSGLGQSVLLGVLADSQQPVRVLEIHECPDLRGMSAMPVDVGTDVWLAGMTKCGPDPRSITDRRYAGPVSRLKVRRATHRLHLPILTVADALWQPIDR